MLLAACLLRLNLAYSTKAGDRWITAEPNERIRRGIGCNQTSYQPKDWYKRINLVYYHQPISIDKVQSFVVVAFLISENPFLWHCENPQLSVEKVQLALDEVG